MRVVTLRLAVLKLDCAADGTVAAASATSSLHKAVIYQTLFGTLQAAN